MSAPILGKLHGDCLPGEPGQFHLWPGIGQGSQSRDHHACAIGAGE